MKGMRRRPSPENLVTVAVLAAAVVFVFVQLQPHLLFRNNTPAGGDMGAHVWGPAFLRDHLLPHGRLSGWAPDWYAGFPALTFYFPLPSLLIVALDVVLPYGVAFKLVTALGLLALPVAAWAFGRLSGMRFPGPVLFGIATLPFMFDRFHTIYGGNIPATMAGEFAFSIGLAVGLVFLGVLARGLETGRHRALAAVLLAVTALCHVLPTFFVLGGALVLVVMHLDRHRLRYAVAAMGGALLLAAFWVVPFLWRIPYTNDMGWGKITVYRRNLFPSLYRCHTGCDPNNYRFPFSQTWHLDIVLALALIGAVASVVLRRRMGTALTGMALLSALAFRYAPEGRLWNARLLPFWFLCLYLLAAVAVAEGARALATVVSRDREPWRWPELATPMVGLAAALLFVALPLQAGWLPFHTSDHSVVPDWVRWNYSGYEGKAAYPEYKAMVDTMKRVGRTHGCGRAMWEYFPDLNRYGTPMAPMLLPYWTHECILSMEGLFFESAASTPYHFLNQSELSKDPSRAQRDLPYRDLDVSAGVQHLQLMGVRYYMAYSQEAVAAADAQPALVPVARSGSWHVYEVLDSAEVVPLRYEPAVLENVPKKARPWLDVAVHFYQDPASWDVPLAASGPRAWPRVAVHHNATTDKTLGAGVDLAVPRRVPVRPARVTHIRTGDDRISFDVDRPGSPVLVKASYFPNWQVSGGRGPWRVTPNLMVVIPTSRHVSLHYGWTPVDGIAWALTIAGIALVVLVARRGAIEYPVAPAPVDDTDDQLDLILGDELVHSGADDDPWPPG